METGTPLHHGASNSWPGWQSTIRTSPGLASDRDELAPTMDSVDEELPIAEPHPSFEFFARQPDDSLANHRGDRRPMASIGGRFNHDQQNLQARDSSTEDKDSLRVLNKQGTKTSSSPIHAPAWWLGLLAPGTLSVQLPDLGDWL